MQISYWNFVSNYGFRNGFLFGWNVKALTKRNLKYNKIFDLICYSKGKYTVGQVDGYPTFDFIRFLSLNYLNYCIIYTIWYLTVKWSLASKIRSHWTYPGNWRKKPASNPNLGTGKIKRAVFQGRGVSPLPQPALENIKKNPYNTKPGRHFSTLFFRRGVYECWCVGRQKTSTHTAAHIS